MHDALWVLQQIAASDRNAFVTVRARSHRGGVIHTQNSLRPEHLQDDWKWLHIHLSTFNKRAAVIEFGANPRTSRSRRHPNSSCVLTSVVVNFYVGVEYTFQDRLEQVAVLTAANCEPSILIQYGRCLYGIYLLDGAAAKQQHLTASVLLNRLIHSSQWKKFAQPDVMLPLPGFFVRGGEGDVVKLLHPDDAVGAAKLYSISELGRFPDVGKEAMKGLSVGDAKTLAAKLLADAARRGDATDVLAGVFAGRQTAAITRMKASLGIFEEPHRNAVPPPEMLHLRSTKLAAQYVCQGLTMRRDLLRAYVASELKLDLDMAIPPLETVRALDRAIIMQLVQRGYTERAVLAFYRQDGHLIGRGKSNGYVAKLYREQLDAARAAVAPPIPVATTPLDTPLLEVVTCVCKQLPELHQSGELTPQRAAVCGDQLLLDGRWAYKVYRWATISANGSPAGQRELQNAIGNCRDTYWLGTRMVNDHKMWCLSMSAIKSLGLLRNSSFLQSV